MVFTELEEYLKNLGLSVSQVEAGGQPFAVISDFSAETTSGGDTKCDVGILRSNDNPWLPQPAIHVRPHLVTMGDKNSQASPLGDEWQYLSRRFERPHTPKHFIAHILTVLKDI